jgi:putative oxidoreductase
MKLGLTLLRITVGATFFAHGAQKLFGWFGGPGLEGTAQGFESMGLKPGRRNALVAGASEAAAARCSPPGCSPRSGRPPRSA